MKKSQMARVLGTAAAFDQRTVGEADVEAWMRACGDMDFDEATEAVIEHYKTSADRLMPVHLIEYGEGEEGVPPWQRRGANGHADGMPSL